ncbi:MAG: hypothetical protein ACFHWX_07820 [Bacteroidota bacterium]
MAKKRTKEEFKELRIEHDFRLNEAYIREDLLPSQKIISINRIQKGHEVILDLTHSTDLNFENLKIQTEAQLMEINSTESQLRIRIPFVNTFEAFVSVCVV